MHPRDYGLEIEVNLLAQGQQVHFYTPLGVKEPDRVAVALLNVRSEQHIVMKLNTLHVESDDLFTMAQAAVQRLLAAIEEFRSRLVFPDESPTSDSNFAVTPRYSKTKRQRQRGN